LFLASKIIEVADICCHGRVVSVLEGGYGRTPKRESERLGNNSNTNSKGDNVMLDKTVFSESVMRHLRALIDPYGMHISFFFRVNCFFKEVHDWSNHKRLFALNAFDEFHITLIHSDSEKRHPRHRMDDDDSDEAD
jgi:hypothetical protein